MKKTSARSKEIWLEEGLKVLEEQGPAALSIDILTQRIKKTKGAFYHHFKNREKYLEALMLHYEKKYVVEITDTVDEQTDQAAQLKTLTELAFRISSNLELVVRSWALNEPVVKMFQDRIDQKRMEHLQHIFRPTCTDPARAKTLALKTYCIYIGMQQVRHLHDRDQFKDLLKDVFTPIKVRD